MQARDACGPAGEDAGAPAAPSSPSHFRLAGAGLHPTQFLLLLLLHGAKQRFEVDVPLLRLLLSLIAGGLLLLLLLVLSVLVLVFFAARAASLGLLLADERDLQVPFGRGVIRTELQRFRVIEDCVIEGLRGQRAVAAIEQ